MAWTRTAYVAAFDAEAGDIASLAVEAQKVLWFNEGQSRLLRRKPSESAIGWAQGDTEVPLPADFIQMDKVVEDDGVTPQPWRVWGENLVMDDSEGASQNGTARLFYWAEWPEMLTTGVLPTELNLSQDYACLYFALHRFYKKLASNRAYYKRYATLVGQNAVSMTDLQQESDRYLQDFLDARADLEPDPPAFFYPN